TVYAIGERRVGDREGAGLQQLSIGGWGGIRTPETLAGLPVFKTGAFNHSATHPAAFCPASVHRKMGSGTSRRKGAKRLAPPPPTVWRKNTPEGKAVCECVSGDLPGSSCPQRS